MARSRKVAANSGSNASFGRPELILVARPEAALRLAPTGFESGARANVRGLQKVLEGVSVEPLFLMSEERIRERVASLSAEPDVPDLGTFYHVSAPPEQMEDLAASLRDLDEVEGAYVKPAGSPPVAAKTLPDEVAEIAAGTQLNDMTPDFEEPATTPDFANRQIYLNAAPAGIDARYAWRFPGGRGAGVRIIDCEWGWRFTHEDLTQGQGGVVIGVNHTDDNHGTAVLGEFSGDDNSLGILGICPDAHVSAASFLTLPTASVIRQAADRLRSGDIMLLEIHRPGPGASGSGQDGFIAIEWWPDDYAAIRYAVARGVIVVEAAGNGARNLDDAIYNQPAAGFPTTWRNPFNPTNPSSGAVLVGAGAPPPGTHGRNHGPDRSRLDFSNHGRRVDTQGWGREVTTTGYGDLQGGSSRDLWYTDQFSGTSSASPIVVGAISCVQGILRRRARPLLTPTSARQLLRSTGSPQQAAPGRPVAQRIGNRPNLRQALAQLLGIASGSTDGEQDQEQSITARAAGQIVINVNSPQATFNIHGQATVQ